MMFNMKWIFLLPVFIVGCSYKEDQRPMMSMQECDRIIRRSEFPPSAKELAKSTLLKWQNGVLDPIPVLMHAQYTYTKEGQFFLDLFMSDEDFDVEGIIIKEIHKKPGERGISFEEHYPLFMRYSAGLTERIRVYIRTFPERRKREKEWNDYIKKGSYIVGYPAVLTSIPSLPEVEVKILVYDERGHVSNGTPLIQAMKSYPLPPGFGK